ncbi:uncharacterized protein AB9W97_021491 isoform 1-T1 [Spinachia spinachia]
MHRPPESDPGQFKVASRRALVLRRNRRTLGRLLVALHQGHARHPRSHHKATVTHRRSQRCAQEGMAKEDARGILLGTFEYDQDGPATQTFEVHHEPEDDFSHVELRITSNWGDEEQTCLYNFRVHGRRV